MSDPGNLGGTPGAGVAEREKFKLAGEDEFTYDVQVPDPTFIGRLVAGGVNFKDLKKRIEEKYPEYTLPDSTCVARLFGSKKQENLGKLKERMGFSGEQFHFLHTDESGNVVRSRRYDGSGHDIDMGSDLKGIEKIKSVDQ